MPRPERLLLIHGAWAGAWVWDGLVAELNTLGWQAEALDLPGDGFHPIALEDAQTEDFHACLAQAIESQPGPVALVGHSGGGMLVTAGAEAHPQQVTHGIWIAGMLIPDGRSFDDIQEDLMGPGGRFGVTPHIIPCADSSGSRVSTEAACRYFFHDADARLAAQAAARLTPQPAAGHRLRTPTTAAFSQLQKLYVLANDDRSVLPQAQRAMAQSAKNIDIVEMASGHAPQLTQAALLAGLINAWLDRE